MKKFFFAIFLVCFCGGAFAEKVSVSSVTIERSDSNIGKKKVFYPAAWISVKNESSMLGFYRLKVRVKNESDKKAEGLVFKYTIRLVLNKEEKNFRDIPYSSQDLRISVIGPKSEKIVYVYELELNNQLRRLKNSGFKAVFMEIEIAKEPRKGDIELMPQIYRVELKQI